MRRKGEKEEEEEEREEEEEEEEDGQEEEKEEENDGQEGGEKIGEGRRKTTWEGVCMYREMGTKKGHSVYYKEVCMP